MSGYGKPPITGYDGSFKITPILSIKPELKRISELAKEIDPSAPYDNPSFNVDYANRLLDLGVRSHSIEDNMPYYGDIRSIHRIIGIQSQYKILTNPQPGSFPTNAREYLYSNLRYQVLRLLAISRDDPIQVTRASLFYLAYEISNHVAYREANGISYQHLGLPYVASILRLAFQQQPTDKDRNGIDYIKSFYKDPMQNIMYFDCELPYREGKGFYLSPQELRELSSREKAILYRQLLLEKKITRTESPLVYGLLDSLVSIYDAVNPIFESEILIAETGALYERTTKDQLALEDANYLKQLANLMMESFEASIDGNRNKVFGFLDEV